MNRVGWPARPLFAIVPTEAVDILNSPANDQQSSDSAPYLGHSWHMALKAPVALNVPMALKAPLALKAPKAPLALKGTPGPHDS